MASSDSGFSAHVTVTMDPEDVPRFLEAFKGVYEKVIQEPECLFFEAYESPDEPGKVTWVENWTKSKEWLFQEQVPKKHYQDYLAVAEPLFKTREFRFLKRLPQFHMAKN